MNNKKTIEMLKSINTTRDKLKLKQQDIQFLQEYIPKFLEYTLSYTTKTGISTQLQFENNNTVITFFDHNKYNPTNDTMELLVDETDRTFYQTRNGIFIGPIPIDPSAHDIQTHRIQLTLHLDQNTTNEIIQNILTEITKTDDNFKVDKSVDKQLEITYFKVEYE